ncbi:MAG: hypothetical protein QN778_08140 [Nitrososphaeraceae archaeon]|nr:hypothetical protein [Nitrososphaeraceae archaeon]
MANYCFTAPILPGGLELAKKWNQENIVDNKEHDEVFKEAGISREQVWISTFTTRRFCCGKRTDNPEKSFKVLATSNKQWAVKFREHLKRAHGFDIAQSSMQLNEVAVNWKE